MKRSKGSSSEPKGGERRDEKPHKLAQAINHALPFHICFLHPHDCATSLTATFVYETCSTGKYKGQTGILFILYIWVITIPLAILVQLLWRFLWNKEVTEIDDKVCYETDDSQEEGNPPVLDRFDSHLRHHVNRLSYRWQSFN